MQYAIVHLIEDVEDGSQFLSSDWPLHVTIIQPFNIEWSLDEMVGKLTSLLHAYAVVESQAEDDVQFGHLDVTLLVRTNSLVRLHNDILDILKQGGLDLKSPEYAREHFRPHCTIQKHARLRKGRRVTFTSVSIVDMSSDESPPVRKILKTIRIRTH